jgi:hypothetical protein
MEFVDNDTWRCSIYVSYVLCASDAVWRHLMLPLRMNLETPPRDSLMRRRFTVKSNMMIVTITVSRVNVFSSDSQ